jgi:hypothetical protein
MKAKDGRIARGNLITEEVREKILNAYIELLRKRIPHPTALAVAERSFIRARLELEHTLTRSVR